jgi:acyl dehydratase
MDLRSLVVGATLPEHRVTAGMPADPVENKIHEDDLARRMGFRGGLVPGVTVYAWMTHPVVAALGPAWLERGSFTARFAKPTYFGETATVCATVAAHTADAVTLDVRVLDEAGQVCATSTMALPFAAAPAPPEPGAYPAAPLPAERPPVSRALLASRTVLGTPELVLDEATTRAFLERVKETLALYREPGGPVHPGLYLDQANRALSRNVRVSPWIHVESQGRHLSIAHVGERLETRAKVQSLYERKGHEFVELDLLILAGGARPVASIRHVAIYRLRGASSRSATDRAGD